MKIRITESDLKQIVTESVKKILMEDNNPYGYGGINTDVYGDDGELYRRYRQDIDDKYRRERERDKAARERQLRNQRQEEYEAQERQNRYNDETFVRNLSMNILRFYNMLKSYEQKGMLRKFFSTRPKFEDYRLSGKDLRQVYSICQNSPDLVDNISPRLRPAMQYFRQLRLI